MYSLARAFCQQTATSMFNERKKLEIWYLSHLQAAKRAQSSLFQCAVSPAFTLLALNEGKKIGKLRIKIWYLSHIKAMKAQSSSCKCTDSPEPLLLAQMRPKSASTRLIDDINGIILLVVSQVLPWLSASIIQSDIF